MRALKGKTAASAEGPKTPERRRALGTLGAALGGVSAAAAGLAAPVVARAAERLVMVTTWPKGAPGVGVNAQRFADRLTAMTDGRLAIEFFAAGELVPPFEVLDALSGGTADVAHSTSYYWVGKQPAFHYFTGLPFGMTAMEFASWLRFGEGQALWEEAYEPFGVLPFFAGSSGTQAGGWFNREIETPDDFQGLKFRISGLGGLAMKRLGVIPVLTPPGEIAPALASGAVDGADWIGPWNDIAFGLHRFAKYYYLPGWHEPGPSLEILIRKERFEALPADLQEAFRTAAAATAQETLADFTFHNIQAFATLESEHGVQVRHFPEPVVKALAKASAEVLEELAATDEFTARVQASYKDFLAKATAYAPNSEMGVMQMRQLVSG